MTRGIVRLGATALPAIVAGMVFATTVQAQIPNDPLVGYWKLDETAGITASDSSVTANAGTHINGPTISGDIPPLQFDDPRSLHFDGVGQCVSVPSEPYASVTDTFTMSFWAKPGGTRRSTEEANVGVTGYFDQQYAIYPNYPYTYGSGHSGAGVSVGTNGISIFEHEANYLPSLLVHESEITGWTHVAVVYTSKIPTLYVDGAAVRTGISSTRIVHPGCSIGGEVGSPYGPYQGWVDDLRIYSRALTPAEIAILAGGYDGLDSIAPAAVTLLVTSKTHGSITLEWTAPADDGDIVVSGPARTYDLRYSTTQPIDTDPGFEAAIPVPVGFNPGAPGSLETFRMTGLNPETTYHFRLRTRDERNWSPLSNPLEETTPADSMPPAPITDLAVKRISGDSVQLVWTAPGDDGMTGTAAAYDLRYSTSGPIDTDGKFALATPFPGVPAPEAPASLQTLTVTGLKRHATYHFSLRTLDRQPNWSLSNSPGATTLAGGSSGNTAPCGGSASALPTAGSWIAGICLALTATLARGSA